MTQDKGVRYGGRAKGTPNKDTAKAFEIVERLKCDPLEFLCLVVNGDFMELKEMPTLDHRITAAKELASYLYPKRKAMEISVDPEIKESFEDYIKSVDNQK